MSPLRAFAGIAVANRELLLSSILDRARNLMPSRACD